MKNKTLLVVILACVLVFSSKPTHAASELETWCLERGQYWSGTTCHITSSVTISSPEALTVLVGETINVVRSYLSNGGTIFNSGTIYVDYHDRPHVTNWGTIVNDGTITAVGEIRNSRGTINNNGTFYHNGRFTNRGIFNNNKNGTMKSRESGILYNGGFEKTDDEGVINNYGTIGVYNWNGFLKNQLTGTINNRGGTIIICDDCTIENDGGTINNYRGIFNNDGIIFNYRGAINNYCSGIYNGWPPVGIPVMSHPCMIWVPLIKG